MSLTLTISRDRGNDCWMVHSNDPRVAELFGTATLPTAYRLPLTCDYVQRQIQALNPGATVLLGAI